MFRSLHRLARLLRTRALSEEGKKQVVATGTRGQQAAGREVSGELRSPRSAPGQLLRAEGDGWARGSREELAVERLVAAQLEGSAAPALRL